MTKTPALLAVEDDPRVVRNWRRLLRGSVELVTAPTLEAARKRTEASSWHAAPCDYVFLDLRLPDGDGGDLLQRLTALQPAPAIAVVSSYLEARRVHGLRARCAVVVSKPAERESLDGILGFLDVHRRGGCVLLEFARAHDLSDEESALVAASIQEPFDLPHTAELHEESPGGEWSRLFRKTGLGTRRAVASAVLRFAARKRARA